MDLLIEDADVVTMSPGGATAGAMLVRDGRIAAVGDPAQVRAAASPGAAVTRLDGATVIPGLIDAHCHVADVGYLAAGADCSPPSAPDIPGHPGAAARGGRPHRGRLVGDRQRLRGVPAA